MNLRTFVAIEFPQEIKKKISQVLRDLENVTDKIKWTEPENFHLTLKFLGPTPGDKREAIASALHAVGGRQAPFEISLLGVGAFPSLNKPQILWVGVKEGAQQLITLAAAINQALEPLGFETDARAFSAHATLGRVKSLRAVENLKKKLSPHLQASFGQCQVKVLTWHQSTLTPEGPVYEALEKIPLKGANL